MDEKYLDLAIVISCNESGCQVRPADSQEILETVYAAPVLNRVKIRPGQLVAINLQAGPPEIVWRWYRMKITSVGAGTEDLGVDDRGVRQLVAKRAPGFDSALVAGDWVWVGGIGYDQGWEAIDQVSPEGGLSQPERVRQLVFPPVLGFYNQATA